MGKINWTLRTFRLDELTDYYKNPRSLSEKEFKQLKTSLDKFGMIDKPIVNADSANTIIGGHQRKHVLEASGAKECECWIPDRELSDKEVEELNIRLNKNTGSWDFDTLANEFELDDLLEWGFDKGELDLDLWADDAPEDVEPQIDKAEELRVKWGVETGQLWQLGEHRLICGDCTDKAVVERLLGNDKPEMTFIDPPYNALKSWKKDEAHGETRLDPSKWFANDNMEWDEYWLFIKNAFDNMAGHSAYVCCDYRIYAGLLKVLLTTPYELKHCIVWKKNVWGLGKRFRFQHEFVIYACQKDAPFYGNRAESDVWEIDAVRGANVDHNTPKPVAIPERAIACSSQESDIIYDGFLGSGTTLIACERLGRKCRAVEISPAYVAVAIQRWVDVTGGEPVLLDT